MIAVNNKVWFLREGLFAKYVISLVGLVLVAILVFGFSIAYRAEKNPVATHIEGSTILEATWTIIPLALFMVTNNLKPADVLDPDRHLAFPKSVIEFFRGDIGQPPGGFGGGRRRRPADHEKGARAPPAPAAHCESFTARVALARFLRPAG